MVRIVQKYGGTSVANVERIRSVAEHIKSCYEQRDELIIVVSARAGVTNAFLKEAHELAENPNRADLDALLYTGELETIALLSIALNELDVPAVSRNAYQAGIITCSTFGNARIHDIIGGDIEDCLAQKKVVIVAGFQGIDEHLRPTTLGRGGSDLTAIALSQRFNADKCEIFTDVDGVFSADPRVVESPFLIPEISHDSLLRLTFFDNKVMQDRSVALAKKLGISFKIASSLNHSADVGTSVVTDLKCNESYVISLTYKRNLTLFGGVSDEDIFGEVIRFLVANKTDLSFLKHSSNGFFLDEVCFEDDVFKQIGEQFLSNYSKFYKKINLAHGLDRIDIVGTSLEYCAWLEDALDIAYKNTIFRAEYGKNGFSFLLKSEDFTKCMNDLHSAIFS